MPRDNQWTIQLAPKHRQLLEIIANEQASTQEVPPTEEKEQEAKS
jgi:hypothetical protein